MALDAKSLREYPVDTGIPRGSILDPHFFPTDYLPDLSVALLSMLMMLLSTLTVIRCLICDNN